MKITCLDRVSATSEKGRGSEVDFLKESRRLHDGLNRIGCRDGLSFLLTLMVTDYKQVARDRTTGSEIFGAGMKDVTC